MVPVLSNKAMLTAPARFILWGWIVKIFDRLRRDWAYTIPTVSAAGNAGGTIVVTKTSLILDG